MSKQAKRSRTKAGVVGREIFSSIIQLAYDPIIVIDEDQNILDQGAGGVFGYCPSEVIRQSLAILLPPSSSAEIRPTQVRGFQNAPETGRRIGEQREISGRRNDGMGS